MMLLLMLLMTMMMMMFKRHIKDFDGPAANNFNANPDAEGVGCGVGYS